MFIWEKDSINKEQEDAILDVMENLELLDIVEITGFLATREKDKKAE